MSWFAKVPGWPAGAVETDSGGALSRPHQAGMEVAVKERMDRLGWLRLARAGRARLGT